MNPHELPTPRTKAATFYRHANEACVLAEVCEQIEQEAAAWKAVAERYRDACVDLYPRYADDEQRLDEINEAFDTLTQQLKTP